MKEKQRSRPARSTSPERREKRVKGNSFVPVDSNERPMYVSAGFLPAGKSNADLPTNCSESLSPRLAPETDWKKRSESGIKDDSRREKFMRLMGAKKNTSTSGYEKRIEKSFIP